MEQGQTRKQYRRELAENAAKNIKSGVFKVTNTANGKIFVGSAPNLEAKWNSMAFQLNMGSAFMNRELQQDWNTFGPDKFTFDVLAELKKKEGENTDVKRELAELEALWIEELKPYGEQGYNTEARG